MSGMCVNPMLKSVYCRYPGKNVNDSFQMRAPGAVGVGGRIKLFQKFIPKQFHTHRSDLAKLDRRTTIRIQVLRLRGQCMESVARLVQDGLDIPLQTDSVHENERQSCFG